MKKQKLTLLLFLITGFIAVQAQRVTNIQPQLDGNNMQISYDIKGAKFNQTFTVELYVSTDGGKTYQGPMSLIATDEKEIVGGANILVWDVFKDLYSLDYEFFFDIRAKVIEKEIKKYYFVQYSAGALVSSIDYITPFGFRLGVVGKTGWYVAGYFNTFKTAAYSYDGETIDEDIFYEFTDEALYPRMAVTAGLTFQLGWKSHIYLGAGYATKKHYNQINELNIDGPIAGKHWVNVTAEEEAGAEVEAGTILIFNKLSISLGLSTFKFKHIGANVGVGLAF